MVFKDPIIQMRVVLHFMFLHLDMHIIHSLQTLPLSPPVVHRDTLHPSILVTAYLSFPDITKHSGGMVSPDQVPHLSPCMVESSVELGAVRSCS